MPNGFILIPVEPQMRMRPRRPSKNRQLKRNNAVEGKGRGNGKVWCGLKEAVARDDGSEEETGDVHVILILHVCNKHTNVLVSPYFGCVREGRGMMLPGKKEDIKEDA
ncbi:hypothetical protein G5I_07226 [Acromyrmex echinatior]|uniref:Uncharacterized protein n=1 Tax=Acromyrmex echinatior TaxID=103372 RepID=F4WN77_ACREC|nr:hypothetical protein G5I_07226 [Acromyrmex echinatior]